MNEKTRKAFYRTLFVIIVVLAIVFSLGAMYKADQAADEKLLKVENQVMLDRISKLLNLPDEAPIISTVNSKEDFAKAPAFRDAEKGDKLIVWVSANQAVLYRPSTNKVIDVTTVKATVETFQPLK